MSRSVVFVSLFLFVSNVAQLSAEETRGIDVLAALKSNAPNCDLHQFVASKGNTDDGYNQLNEDLKKLCSSSDSSESHRLLCRIVLIELQLACARQSSEKFTPLSYTSTLTAARICRLKDVPTVNNWIWKKLSIDEQKIGGSPKDLCDKITSTTEALSMARFSYKLARQIRRSESQTPAAGKSATENKVDNKASVKDAVVGAKNQVIKAAESAKDVVVDTGSNLVKTVKDKAEAVVDSAKKTAQNIKEAGVDLVKKTGDTVKEKAAEGAEKAGEVAESAKDTAIDAGNKAGDTVKDGAKKIKETGEATLDKAKETAANVKDAAADAADKTGDTMKDGVKKVKETGETALDKAKETAANVKDAAADAADKAGDTVKDGVKKIKETGETVLDKAKQIAGSVKDVAADAADKAGDTVKDGVKKVKETGEAVLDKAKETVVSVKDAAADVADKTVKKAQSLVGKENNKDEQTDNENTNQIPAPNQSSSNTTKIDAAKETNGRIKSGLDSAKEDVDDDGKPAADDPSLNDEKLPEQPTDDDDQNDENKVDPIQAQKQIDEQQQEADSKDYQEGTGKKDDEDDSNFAAEDADDVDSKHSQTQVETEHIPLTSDDNEEEINEGAEMKKQPGGMNIRPAGGDKENQGNPIGRGRQDPDQPQQPVDERPSDNHERAPVQKPNDNNQPSVERGKPPPVLPVEPPPQRRKGGIKLSKMPRKSDDEDGWSGNFITYFLVFTLVVVIGYLTLHNKNKLMAYLVEGRRSTSSRTGGRPSHRHYEKLKSAHDEHDLNDSNVVSTNDVVILKT